MANTTKETLLTQSLIQETLIQHRLIVLERVAELLCDSCERGIPRIDDDWHLDANIRMQCGARRINPLIREAKQQLVDRKRAKS